jgi:hypothetical protein
MTTRPGNGERVFYCPQGEQPMEFLREYQTIIVAISSGLSTALLAIVGFIYNLLTAKQREHESRVFHVLDDHEQRLRKSVARSDWENLVAEARGLKTDMQSAIQTSCAHNTQTRLELHTALMDTERRLADKIDAAFGRRGS